MHMPEEITGGIKQDGNGIWPEECRQPGGG